MTLPNRYIDFEAPARRAVEKGYSWTEQLGIALACLVENDQRDLIDWIKAVSNISLP